MINGKRVLALIPARAGSKGLPDKNIRQLHGRPLLAWPVLAARGSAYVDTVAISTDSQHYADIAAGYGAEVPFIRPAALAADTSPSIDFMLHALNHYEHVGTPIDYLLLLEPTSPLTEASDIDAALEQLEAAGSAADALVGVTAMVTSHPAYAVKIDFSGAISPYAAANFASLPRRQDIEPIYCLDGTLYLSTVAALRRERSFCHAKTLGYVTERHKALEVDDFVDFVCIEAVMANLEAIKRESERSH